MSEATAEAGETRAPSAKPPGEVVLPLPLYLLLLAEVAGVAFLRTRHPEESGGERWSLLIGWVGTASMCVMHVYSIRRRVRALSHWGKLRYWLYFHIFCGLQGALFVTYHSLHMLIVGSLFARINIACVFVVVLSGIYGRYLFGMLPKGLSGERLSAHQVDKELSEVTEEVRRSAPTPELADAIAKFASGERLTGRLGLFALVREDLRSRASLRGLNTALASALSRSADKATGADLAQAHKLEGFVASARRRVLLSRKLVTLQASEAIFRTWTIFHKPLTFVLLGTTLLHVLAHYLYTAGAYGGNG